MLLSVLQLRELVILLLLSFGVMRLLVFCFSFSQCRGLVCVTISFPGHTHLLLSHYEFEWRYYGQLIVVRFDMITGYQALVLLDMFNLTEH